MHRHASAFNEDAIVTPESKYSPMSAYADTKLCNLLFTKELDRRIKAAGIEGVTAVACHPGLTAANLNNASAASHGFFASIPYRIISCMPRFQSAEVGALPTLLAATAPGVQSGDYFGPRHLRNYYGHPTLEEPMPPAQSESAATKLWTLSERLAKLSFDIK